VAVRITPEGRSTFKEASPEKGLAVASALSLVIASPVIAEVWTSGQRMQVLRVSAAHYSSGKSKWELLHLFLCSLSFLLHKPFCRQQTELERRQLGIVAA
jgi:hypothetical protein